MTNSKDKTVAIALILLLTASSAITLFAANAQNPTYDFPTFLFIYCSPNPVGVGQTVYVMSIFSRPTPTAEGYGGDWYENVTIEMVDPDGVKTVYGPFRNTGMIGGITLTVTPDQVGNYTFQSFYPGETLDLMNPVNQDTLRGWNRHLNGSRLLPSQSDIVTLVVQEEPVGSIYETPPLPTEFWTRPIYGTNWDWAEAGANWFGMGGSGRYDVTGNLQPYGTAPNTAHIMWTQPLAGFFGGQPGDPIPSTAATAYSSTSGVAYYFSPIILNGILYYNVIYSDQFTGGGWEAVDIRTGEVLWSKPAGITGSERLAFGQVQRVHNDQEYGSWAYLWSSPVGGEIHIYDAKTCNLVANITNARSMSYLMNVEENTKGALLGYYTSGGNLTMWNSSKVFTYMQQFFVTTLVVIGERTHVTGTHDWAEGIEWSIPLPTTLNGENISLSVAATTPEVILLRQVGGPLMFHGVNTYGWQITAGYDAKTGAKLWGPVNQTIPAREDVTLLCARDGYYILHNKDRHQAYCYSLETGHQLWGPVQLQGSAMSHIWRSADIAYGRVYIWDVGGYVNAINLETGELEWTFNRGPAQLDSPYGFYPIFGYNVHSIADGKLFLAEGINYTPPQHATCRLALNCTDGSLVWKILNWNSKAVGAIADGYFLTWNSFDNQLYSFGKGPSATAVAASPAVLVHGGSVIVTGTVTDISAGASQQAVAANFPNGLPCVSDDSMEAWMEYVYMQQIKPTNATGVEVSISVLDPNDNCYEVGTTTSDDMGFYKFAFTPEVPGAYTVIATFSGSESYYGSNAETAINVEDAPAATPAPTPTPAPMTDSYVLGIGSAILIAVIIGFALLFLLLRKR